MRLALHQDALAMLHDLRRNHPLVAGTASRLAEIVEEDITAFKAGIELQRLESTAQGRATAFGVNLVDMRALVEALFEQRRIARSERDPLKNRIEEYLIVIGAPDQTIPSVSVDAKLLVSGGSAPARRSGPEGEKTSSHATQLAEERAEYVAKILKELTVIKNRVVVTGELQPLRREYPLYDCWQLVDEHPHLARKLEVVSERKRVISLALDFAAVKLGKARSTIATAWKKHKPKEFRQNKPRLTKKTTARTKRRL
jgi:hypothetical protein